MLSVEQAYENIMAYFSPLEAEDTPILMALGQVLAEDIVSPLQIPPLDNSAMDGYAVRHADIVGSTAAAPKVLQVSGHIAAGHVQDLKIQSKYG